VLAELNSRPPTDTVLPSASALTPVMFSNFAPCRSGPTTLRPAAEEADKNVAKSLKNGCVLLGDKQTKLSEAALAYNKNVENELTRRARTWLLPMVTLLFSGRSAIGVCRALFASVA
jgi:hypothetical protein